METQKKRDAISQFKDITKYSEWDKFGFPTKDSNLNPLSKTHRKKLLKIAKKNGLKFDEDNQS